MRNINELIGIIKGISFDDVINAKEVELLRTWNNKNRNLAYKPKEASLIEVVDALINENSIYDIEKKLLNLSIKEFAIDSDDKTYELNGIILGIICDDKLNELEIYGLKKWVSKNKGIIKEQKQYKELCDEIEDIIKDGKINKKEEQELLNVLYLKTRNSQFEVKLDYLCKLVNEKKNIGIELIDILDNESVKTEIHKRAERQINEALRSYGGTCSNYEIIVVSLVLIALLEYNGNYYDSVRKTYKSVYENFNEQKVEGFIRDVLNRYKNNHKDNGRTRIINVALENAIVPQAFLLGFFELIFDIYRRNFECYMPEDPYEDFKFVFEGLRNAMISEGDDISINVTQKTYKLTAATKQLIQKEEGIDDVAKLSILVANLIDKRYWGDPIKVSNSYLKTGFEEWQSTLKDINIVSNRHRANNTELKSRWEPKIIIDGTSVYLVAPFHRIKSDYDYHKLKIMVSNGNDILYIDEDPYVEEIIGGYQIKPKKIKIDKPLGNLSYKLICDSTIIYDSKDKLYRRFIIFNLEGCEVKNNTDFDGTVQICYKNNDVNFENTKTREFYNIGYVNVKVGDAINIGNEILSFSSITKPGVFGKVYDSCFVYEKNNDNKIQVYKEVKFIAFESKDKSAKYEIILNEKPYKLSDLKYEVSSQDTTIRYVVELELEQSGIYSLEVNHIQSTRKHRILDEKIVYDKNFSFSSNKINESQYSINIKSDLLENDIDTKISLEDFDIRFITFIYKNQEYGLLLPFDFGFYSLDGGKWNSMEEELWIGDITQDTVMRVYDSKCDGALLYRDTGEQVEDNIAIKDRAIFKEISIGFLNTYKNSNKYVVLVLTKGGKAKYAYFCYNNSIIDKDRTEIKCLDYENSKRISITPIFKGKNDVYFKIFNANEKELYKSEYLKSGKANYIKGLKSFCEYTFRFYEKQKNKLFGQDGLIHETTGKFYARCDLVGKSFKINTAFYNENCKNENIEKECRFDKVFLRIDKRINKDVFKGEIYIETSNNKWWLDGINPIEIEICSDINNGVMDVYITNNGDGLLLDTRKHRLLNTMEHPTAPDIFLFNISMKEG